MTPFERALVGELEGSHGDRVHVGDVHGATALHHYAGLNWIRGPNARCNQPRRHAVKQQIGRASCRERVEIAGEAESSTKKSRASSGRLRIERGGVSLA